VGGLGGLGHRPQRRRVQGAGAVATLRSSRHPGPMSAGWSRSPDRAHRPSAGHRAVVGRRDTSPGGP
jgi:hypothetical protein